MKRDRAAPRERRSHPGRERAALLRRLAQNPLQDFLRPAEAVAFASLERDGLAETREGRPAITAEGTAWLKRRTSPEEPYLAQHGVAPSRANATAPDARLRNECESPLAWLARRKDAGGKPLIGAEQFAAGERLREDFTRGSMMPRIGANWSAPVARGRRGGGGEIHIAESVLAAKERVNRAVIAVGPELAGVLLDVCCFLKGLETVEQERGWPRRASKIVLGLALDRLARHYGIVTEISGRERAPMHSWQAEGARPVVRF